MEKRELIKNNPKFPARVLLENENCTAGLRYFEGFGWLAPVCGSQGLLAVISGETEALVRAQIQKDFPRHQETDLGDVAAALTEFAEYFAGSRRQFSLRCDFGTLTPFSRTVLEELARVPYGETVTYGELACQSGRPAAARAVGSVMAHNRWPLVLPCHRVVGADGALVGYSGGCGVASKRWLLALEQKTLFSSNVKRVLN